MQTTEYFGRVRQPISIAAMVLATALLAAPAVSHADTVYVSNWWNYTIDTFSPGGHGSAFGSSLVNPTGLAIDGTGNLYVSNVGSSTSQFTPGIEEFTPQGVGSVFANTGQYIPQGLTFDSAGNLYAAVGNTIEKYTPQGASAFATGLDVPYGLAFDSSGNLYAANWGNDTIEKITPDGTSTSFTNTRLSEPRGLAFDSAGNLYVANGENNTIEEFKSSGGILSSIGSVFTTNGLSGPWGLAFDSAGNLYAANFNNNTIEEFKSSDGALSSTGSVFATGLSGPAFIAIEQIPEPSTWAMVGLGLSALLVFRRRKV